jgi:hypothetical protein
MVISRGGVGVDVDTDTTTSGGSLERSGGVRGNTDDEEPTGNSFGFDLVGVGAEGLRTGRGIEEDGTRVGRIRICEAVSLTLRIPCPGASIGISLIPNPIIRLRGAVLLSPGSLPIRCIRVVLGDDPPIFPCPFAFPGLLLGGDW